MKAASELSRQLNRHYTAHVLTYRRNEKNGCYELLLGQKSVVSLHLVVEYLTDRVAFQKRVENILNVRSQNVYQQLRKLGFMFHSASSGKYCTPGGQPLKYVREDPKETAAREWIEEVFNLFNISLKKDELFNKIKQNLIELHSWQDTYNPQKYGVIYALDLDELIKVVPNIAAITVQKNLDTISSQIITFQGYLMRALLNSSSLSEKINIPFKELPEFELIVWVKFTDLNKYIFENCPLARQVLYHWLLILFPIYESKIKQLLDTFHIRDVDDLFQYITQYLDIYDVKFIAEALNKLNGILRWNVIIDTSMASNNLIRQTQQNLLKIDRQSWLKKLPELDDKELEEMNESFRTSSLQAILRAGRMQIESSKSTASECQPDNENTEQQKLSTNKHK